MGVCPEKSAPHPSSSSPNRPPPSTTGGCLAEAAPRPSSSASNRLPASTMALCHAESAAPDASSMLSWTDLPPDVADLVLCHLTSYADRLTFGAVCRDWRLAVQRHCALPGTTTPWLNVGPGVYQSLDDGEVHRLGCHGSSGCFILYYHDPPDTTDGTPRPGGGRCLYLSNPFHASCASIEIMWPCREPSKIVLCSSKLSIAVILHRGICTIAPFWPADMCRPSVQHPWLPLIGDVVDMAFYRGRIFTVARSGELISHDLYTLDRENVVKSSKAWDQQPVDSTVCHLVVSADTQKLLMVRWSIPPPRKPTGCPEVDDHHGAMDLHVFEADFSKGKWSEVKELGGQSLVVSRSCCRAFGSMDPNFSQGNLVYILGIDWHQKRRTIAGVGPCRCHDCCAHVNGDIPSYCMYDMMTGTLSLVSLGGGHKMDGAMSEWFFPSE